jgi:hypothetical protein
MRKKKTPTLRAYSSRAELKYTGLRSLFSDMYYLDETFDKMLKMALLEEYRNNPETISTLRLTGLLDALDKNIKWLATKADMVRFMRLAEQLRWDRKRPLSKEEAVARFFSGKQPNKIANMRPSYFMAQPGTPYTPKKGSSVGKLRTRQIGAVRVERDFRKLMEAIFSIGDGIRKRGQKKAKMPNVSINRFIR